MGGKRNVSIGMMIRPSGTAQDLTTSHGIGYQELLAKYRQTQRDDAVATGKDYCKSSGRRTVHAGGQTFICGVKRGREKEEDVEDMKELKRDRPNVEHEVKMAAIME